MNPDYFRWGYLRACADLLELSPYVGTTWNMPTEIVIPTTLMCIYASSRKAMPRFCSIGAFSQATYNAASVALVLLCWCQAQVGT
jgi:hypothetical protein